MDRQSEVKMKTQQFVSLGLVLMFANCVVAQVLSEKFTLSSGIVVESSDRCEPSPTKADAIVNLARLRNSNEYRLKIRATFPTCDRLKTEPFLSVTKGRRTTLQLYMGTQVGGCECQRMLVLRFVNRLEPKEILYVLAGHEVIGHTIVP
jgi:hypothetical protein